MSLRRLVWLFLILFAAPPLSYSQEENLFFQLEKLVYSSPDSLIKLVNTSNEHLLDQQISTYLLASAYEQIGKYEEVDSLIQHAFRNYSFQEDSSLYVKYLILLADQRKITDEFEDGLKQLHSAVGISKRIKDTSNLVDAHVSLGELYRATEYFKSGLDHLETAELLLNNFSKEGMESLLAKLYGRRSAIFMQSETFLDSVETLSFKSLLLARKIGDLDLQASSLNELGYLFTKKNDPKAEQYLKEAISIWEDMSLIAYSSNARLNLSRFYLKNERFQEGIDVLNENLSVVENNPWKWYKGEYYNILSNLYFGMNNYEKAYTFLSKAKDSLLKVNEIQYNEQLALISTQLGVNQKEQELYQNQVEIEKAKLEADSRDKENKALLISLLAILLISIIISAFLVYSNKQRKELKEQKSVISTTNQQLSDVIAQKEALLKEINHRVKNNLSILSSLLYLQQKKLKSGEAKEALKKSLLRINTISLIHESLYNRDDMEKVNFQEYLSKLTNYIKEIYWNIDKPIEIKIECHSFKPELSTSIPLAMIINELITNSFKHAFHQVEQASIIISFKENTLSYSDNGPGTRTKENNETLGLKLIELFASQINSSIESKLLEGKFTHSITLNT